MEVGTSHGVVWYFVVQKITKPMTDHYFDNPQHKPIISNVNEKFIIKIKGKVSVRFE